MLLLVGVALALADWWCAIQGRTPLQKKLPPRIPVHKYPIRKYGTKTIYVKYTFTNTPYVVLHWKSWTKFISRSHTPYVVLHEESWVKFISPIQWINPLEDFFLSSGTLDMTSSAFIALLQKQTSFRKSCNKYTIKSPNLLTGSRFHFWLAR